MDPNLFNLDENRLIEVLFTIVVLSFFVERALSVLFGWRPFVKRYDGKGVKEIIALVVSAAICIAWEFDAFSILLVSEKMTLYGKILTGAIIAGGSKGSVKLFRDVLNIRTRAEEEKHPGKPADDNTKK
jgi:hypothetical protein